MDGYYDRMVTHSLEIPLALCGFIGAGVPQTAAALSALTGLPLIDIERQLEHHAGAPLHQHFEHPDLKAAEANLIERALVHRPCGVIALRASSLNDRKVAALIEAKAQLIYLHRDVFYLFSQVQQMRRQDVLLRSLELTDRQQSNIAEMATVFRRWEPQYLGAKQVVYAENMRGIKVAQQLIRMIPEL